MSPDVFPGTALLDRLAERTNPVLVKEVRSALRGRTFAGGFIFVLVLALVASTIAMIVETTVPGNMPSGLGYLTAIAVVFGLGAHGLVPFTAMASMSGEHDEGSLELLQLSGVSPARLVLGKLGAAAVQAALIYAAFLPFLSFAFLLQGVDLVLLVASTLASFVGSIAFSALAIFLGAVLRVRWKRVLGYVVLAIVLMVGVQGLFGWIAFGFFSGSTLSWRDYLLGLAITATVTAVFCVQATARLQHAEENRSTALRVLGTATLLAAAAFGVHTGHPDETFTWLLFGLGFATPSMLLAVTEAERMPRAVLARARLRGSPWFLAPWMPGGGRGVLLVLVNGTLALVASVVASLIAGGSGAVWWRMVGALAALEIWLAFALLVPSGLAARWLDTRWVQMLARVACIALPVVLLLLPAFLRFLGGSSSSAFRHPGNPAHLAEQIFDAKEYADLLPVAIVAVLAAALVAALNVPRVLRSLGEVRRERARRATRSAEVPVAQAQP